LQRPIVVERQQSLTASVNGPPANMQRQIRPRARVYSRRLTQVPWFGSFQMSATCHTAMASPLGAIANLGCPFKPSAWPSMG